jgi:hypothetical protein
VCGWYPEVPPLSLPDVVVIDKKKKHAKFLVHPPYPWNWNIAKTASSIFIQRKNLWNRGRGSKFDRDRERKFDKGQGKQNQKI